MTIPAESHGAPEVSDSLFAMAKSTGCKDYSVLYSLAEDGKISSVEAKFRFSFDSPR